MVVVSFLRSFGPKRGKDLCAAGIRTVTREAEDDATYSAGYKESLGIFSLLEHWAGESVIETIEGWAHLTVLDISASELAVRRVWR